MNHLSSIAMLSGIAILFAIEMVPSRKQEALGGVSAVQLPVTESARRIAVYAQRELPMCYQQLNGEGAALAKALIAVEYSATGRLEALTEAGLVRLLNALGLPLPDWSVGPAQIRASALRKVTTTPDEGIDPFENKITTHALLDVCTNVRAAQKLVRLLLEKHEVSSHGTEDGLRGLIAEYNGQVTRAPEHEIYTSIVLEMMIFTEKGGKHPDSAAFRTHRL